jgi:hypothetical protein
MAEALRQDGVHALGQTAKINFSEFGVAGCHTVFARPGLVAGRYLALASTPRSGAGGTGDGGVEAAVFGVTSVHRRAMAFRIWTAIWNNALILKSRRQRVLSATRTPKFSSHGGGRGDFTFLELVRCTTVDLSKYPTTTGRMSVFSRHAFEIKQSTVLA